MPISARLSLRKNPLVRDAAGGSESALSLQLKVTRKPACPRSDQQHVIGFFHHEPGNGDRVDKAFDRRDRAGPKSSPVHQGSVHPLDPIQLAL